MGKDWIYDQISINTVSQFQTAHSYDNRALSRGNFREVLWLLFREETAVHFVCSKGQGWTMSLHSSVSMLEAYI